MAHTKKKCYSLLLFFPKINFFFFRFVFICLGLKKFMWPLFIGLQVVKTALLVLFLPSIIGSVGKIVGKGLPSLSGSFSQFSQPNAHTEQVDDLEFKDNSLNGDHEEGGTMNSHYQYAIPGENRVKVVMCENRLLNAQSCVKRNLFITLQIFYLFFFFQSK